jgi:hypothetical protein
LKGYLNLKVTTIQKIKNPAVNNDTNINTNNEIDFNGPIDHIENNTSTSSPASPTPPISCDKENDFLWRIYAHKGDDGVPMTIYARNVVLATGGKQELPKFPNASHNSKLINSDNLCTATGLEFIRNKLIKSNCGKKQGKIVIVGGSHSSFSAAWMLINKLDLRTNNNNSSDLNKTDNETSTSSNTNISSQLGTNSICLMHRSLIQVFYATKREADNDEYSDIGNYHIYMISISIKIQQFHVF